MKQERFKVINFVRELIILIDSKLDNFPKKDIELKNRIKTNSYDILEKCYEANNTTDKVKKLELLNIVLAKIKIVDFLINLSYDKEIINQKVYYRFRTKIDDISKYTCGWMKSIK